MSKIIGHIDLNAFFVRCEEIKDPSLIGKPVAVGHEGRAGIVSTCSYKAREYGVSSGMPMFKAKKACPSLIIREVDFPFYKTKSREFFHLVKRFSKSIEMMSIDECFVDFTDVLKKEKNPVKYLNNMQSFLFKETGLSCSIGIAPTRFLAKMGSDMKKPNGLTIIHRKELATTIYPLSIDKMFGIGKKSAPRLKMMGILTIGDLAKRMESDDQTLIDSLGSSYKTFKDWVFGYGDDTIHLNEEDCKSIGASTTLEYDTDEYDVIKRYFKSVAEEVSQRAKTANKYGKTIQIVVRDTEFNYHNRSISFETVTNEETDILDYALELYGKSFLGMSIRLVGITLQNLVDIKDMSIQMTIFNYQEHEEKNKTKLLINDLNRRLKKPSLKRASEVKNEKR